MRAFFCPSAFFHVSQRAVEVMAGQGSGHIVTITTSLIDQPMLAVPSALAALSKGGLNAATRSLAMGEAGGQPGFCLHRRGGLPPGRGRAPPVGVRRDNGVSDSGQVASTRNVIVGFNSAATDRIDLSTIDANAVAPLVTWKAPVVPETVPGVTFARPAGAW
jgi:hypothetical protein